MTADTFRPARDLAHAAACAALASAASWCSPRAAASRTRSCATPANAVGPFYPAQKPADCDADLTQVAGRAGRRKERSFYVTGRVLDTSGRPQAQRLLELWQANAFGRYIHPGDSDASGRLDPDFQGYGTLAHGSDGQFPHQDDQAAAVRRRTPHIHFIVAARSTRLTTQMFFEGEAAQRARRPVSPSRCATIGSASTGRFIDRARGAEDGPSPSSWDIVLPA